MQKVISEMPAQLVPASLTSLAIIIFGEWGVRSARSNPNPCWLPHECQVGDTVREQCRRWNITFREAHCSALSQDDVGSSGSCVPATSMSIRWCSSKLQAIPAWLTSDWCDKRHLAFSLGGSEGRNEVGFGGDAPAITTWGHQQRWDGVDILDMLAGCHDNCASNLDLYLLYYICSSLPPSLQFKHR